MGARPGGDAGRRRLATGDSAPAGGIVHAGCAPHSLFVLDKKRMRRARWKRKNRLGALRCSGPPCARGSAYRCKRRFGLAFGHAIIFCEVDTTVPWRMVPTSSGWLSYCLSISFRYRSRSRAEEPAAAKIGAGCILLPPRAGGFPKGRAFPPLTSARECQPSPAGGRRSAPAQTDPPNIFSFPPGAAHFLFDVSKRKWGAHCPAIIMADFPTQTGGLPFTAR